MSGAPLPSAGGDSSSGGGGDGGNPDGLASASWAHYASRHARRWRGRALVVNPVGGALLHATTYTLEPDGEAVERTSRSGAVAIHLSHTYTFFGSNFDGSGGSGGDGSDAAPIITETHETVFESRTFHVFADGTYTTETPMLVAPALLGTETPFPSAVEHVLPLSASERVRGMAAYDAEGRCRRVALLEEVADGSDWEARPPLALSSLVGVWSGAAMTKRFRGASGGVVGAGVGLGAVPGKASWEETIAATVVGAEFPTTTRSTFGWDGGDRVRRCTVVKPSAPLPGVGGSDAAGGVAGGGGASAFPVADAAAAAVAAATAAAGGAALGGGNGGGGGGKASDGRGRRRDGSVDPSAGETLTVYGTVDGGSGDGDSVAGGGCEAPPLAATTDGSGGGGGGAMYAPGVLFGAGVSMQRLTLLPSGAYLTAPLVRVQGVASFSEFCVFVTADSRRRTVRLYGVGGGALSHTNGTEARL
ncbi:hypothetical protein MMPV_003914 [Pyropia vietnamensis]